MTCPECRGSGVAGATLTDEDGHVDRVPAACGGCEGSGSIPASS